MKRLDVYILIAAAAIIGAYDLDVVFETHLHRAPPIIVAVGCTMQVALIVGLRRNDYVKSKR